MSERVKVNELLEEIIKKTYLSDPNFKLIEDSVKLSENVIYAFCEKNSLSSIPNKHKIKDRLYTEVQLILSRYVHSSNFGTNRFDKEVYIACMECCRDLYEDSGK